MMDTNAWYCRRLAQRTFPDLDREFPAIALSKLPVGYGEKEDKERTDDELPVPHRTLRAELTDLFGSPPPRDAELARARAARNKLTARQTSAAAPGFSGKLRARWRARVNWWLGREPAASPPDLARCFRSADALGEALEQRPDIQSRLAVIVEYTPSQWLLERELEATGWWQPDPEKPCGGRDAYDVARERSASGLCLSGGGIRSATFNLGVLQALARHGCIGKLDYLSSVSGGGYIHQFLANWIWRAGQVDTVEALLDPVPNEPGPFNHPHRYTVQPEPLRWLRRYSNYLAPRKGVFSLDTWTITATWTRNTALNLIVLLSGLFFVLLLPHIGIIKPGEPGQHEIARIVLGVLFLVPVGFLAYWISDLAPPGMPPRFIKVATTGVLGVATIVAPSVYRSVIPGGSVSTPEAQRVFHPVATPAELHYKGSFREQTRNAEVVEVSIDSRESEPGSRLRAGWPAHPTMLGWLSPPYTGGQLVMALFAAVCAGLLLAALGPSRLNPFARALLVLLGFGASIAIIEGVRLLFFVCCFAVPLRHIPALAVALLPTILMGVPFLLMETGLGLAGRASDSGQREWMARLRAVSFLLAFLWLGIVSVSLLGKYAFDWLAAHVLSSYAVWGGWLLTTAAGVFSARSSRTDNGTSGPQESAPVRSYLLELVANVAPAVFILGLLILVSTFVTWCMHVPGDDPVASRHRYLFLLALSFAIAAIFGWRVDVNDFSMHAFYRDRLARCYSGAVDPNRVPNLFSGFTRNDRALRVHQLLPWNYRRLHTPVPPPAAAVAAKSKPTQEQAEPAETPSGYYQGPFPIFNTSINLTFGEDLAYQERKAASFAFTPLFSGYNVGWTAGRDPRNQFNGFVDTRSYVYREEGGVMVATACAISGAAASPNMGYHSNPAVAFLLTVFNVRLGWWMRNPRRRCIPCADESKLPSSPRFGVLKLINELFGQSDDTTSYVYLTDGGHFDNMGLYELIRRRCRTILVCDAEEDPHLNFEGIGSAIRKARLDFGVEITLDTTQAEPPPRAVPPAAEGPCAPDGAAAAPTSNLGARGPDFRTQRPGTSANDSPTATTEIPPSSDPGASTSHAAEAETTETAVAEHTAEVTSYTARPSPSETGTFQIAADNPDAPPGLPSFKEFPGNKFHCVHGTIRYPEDHCDEQFGHILYIKASLTGDEPPDVLNYRREHKAFPYDSTLNQFFTESQFESYRRLGEHIPLTDDTAKWWLETYLRKSADPPSKQP